MLRYQVMRLFLPLSRVELVSGFLVEQILEHSPVVISAVAPGLVDGLIIKGLVILIGGSFSVAVRNLHRLVQDDIGLCLIQVAACLNLDRLVVLSPFLDHLLAGLVLGGLLAGGVSRLGGLVVAGFLPGMRALCAFLGTVDKKIIFFGFVTLE